MKFAHSLAEVRARTVIADDFDPIGIILNRVSMNAHTIESRAVRKACLVLIAGQGEVAENDLWAFGQDALGLLDAFAMRRLAGRYPMRELEMFADKLRRVTS